MSTVSSIKSRSVSSEHGYALNTVISKDLPRVSYSRAVSKGQPIERNYRVKEYWTEPIGNTEIKVQSVSTFEKYASGCTDHEDCLGHLCITPGNNILLPQKLAVTLNVMSNDFAKMAESVYKQDTRYQGMQYNVKLRQLMLGKDGKMRGRMTSGPVDGSCRMVVSPCWEIPPNHIAIPKRMAENMRILRIVHDEETKLPVNHYIEDRVREGDWFVGVRPPSLWAGNVQPMKAVLWDHESLGISPSNADQFHCDHDGDEFHLSFLTRPESISECEKWRVLDQCKFDKAVRECKLPEQCYGPIPARALQRFSPEKYREHNFDFGLRGRFMVHSTLSIRELQEGVKLPDIAKAARVKEAMADMLVHVFNNLTETRQNYRDESLRGIRDVMAQRLQQGDLGNMSREAKIAASCIKYAGNGKFEIYTSSGIATVIDRELEGVYHDKRFPLGGNPCMRAVSSICAVAQQAALDSHRVSQEKASSMDLIQNLIRGGHETLIVVAGKVDTKHEWNYYTKGKTYIIADIPTCKKYASVIIATYNSEVLKEMSIMGRDVNSACKNGIMVVCSYYNICLTMLELHALSHLMCYKYDIVVPSVTTKDGMSHKKLQWFSTLFCNHFGLLSNMQKYGTTRRHTRPYTITEAASFCNFDYL